MTLEIPTPPNAIRTFAGFAAEHLTPKSDSSNEEIANMKSEFYQALGSTFMPGTPLMQAPLGLSAYLPAVIDPGIELNHLPDEVAIIVYASQDIYNQFRSTSLSRRMYTYSHFAAFNMPRSLALFPGEADNPGSISRGTETSYSWYLMDQHIDWQSGSSRVLMMLPEGESSTNSHIVSHQRSLIDELQKEGIDQGVTLYNPSYVVMWLHSSAETISESFANKLVPSGYTSFRNLESEIHYVLGDEDNGITIEGASAHNFRFSRQLRFFNL